MATSTFQNKRKGTTESKRQRTRGSCVKRLKNADAERRIHKLEARLRAETERADFFENLAGEMADIATRLKVHIQMMKCAHNIAGNPAWHKVMQDYTEVKLKRYKPSRRTA